jgi:DNA-binding GntR family transcriptional regulator
MQPLGQIRSQRLSASSTRICTALRLAILEQALSPGTKLPEDLVGEQFGVSRTVVRDAFIRLHTEGLIDLQPHRGATVASPDIEEAREVFEARRCLEAATVRALAARVDPAVIARLEAHVAEEVAARDGDAPRSIRLAGEFHVVLAELTGNRVLARFVSQVVSRCSLILAVHHRPHSPDCAVEEHRAIIDAVRRGDAEAAAALMESHVGAVAARAAVGQPREVDIAQVLLRYTAGAGQ